MVGQVDGHMRTVSLEDMQTDRQTERERDEEDRTRRVDVCLEPHHSAPAESATP